MLLRLRLLVRYRILASAIIKIQIALLYHTCRPNDVGRQWQQGILRSVIQMKVNNRPIGCYINKKFMKILFNVLLSSCNIDLCFCEVFSCYRQV